MTPEQIAELERLEREATPGEWGVLIAPESHGRWYEVYADGPQRVAVLSRANSDANGAFMTAARNALPSLLDSARDLASLRAAVEALAGEWERRNGEPCDDCCYAVIGSVVRDLRALLPGGDASKEGVAMSHNDDSATAEEVLADLERIFRGCACGAGYIVGRRPWIDSDGVEHRLDVCSRSPASDQGGAER